MIVDSRAIRRSADEAVAIAMVMIFLFRGGCGDFKLFEKAGRGLQLQNGGKICLSSPPTTPKQQLLAFHWMSLSGEFEPIPL
jgi:hypothetical protein